MLRKAFPILLVIALLIIWPIVPTQARGHLEESTPTATPTRWLTITAPNGGEVVYVGEVYRITWDFSPNIDKVSIGYKSCPSCLSWIATNVPNTGYFDWTVYVGNTTVTQFTIQIIGYETGVGSVTDYSDAPFTVLDEPAATLTATIPPPTATPAPPTATPIPSRWLTVTAPNGGEVMYVGDIFRITWDSSLNIDKVSIGYKSCPSCLDWIATNIPNAGYYDWNVYVGNTTNTQFTIQIIGYETGVGSVIDVSDGDFTVLPPPTPTFTPTFTPVPQLDAPILIYPIDGETIRTARPVFDWTDVAGATSYRIQVSRYNDFFVLLVDTSTTASQYYSSTKLPRRVDLYWRVRAFGEIDPSAWAVGNFRIK